MVYDTESLLDLSPPNVSDEFGSGQVRGALAQARSWGICETFRSMQPRSLEQIDSRRVAKAEIPNTAAQTLRGAGELAMPAAVRGSAMFSRSPRYGYYAGTGGYEVDMGPCLLTPECKTLT